MSRTLSRLPLPARLSRAMPSRPTTLPVFYAEQLRLEVGEERAERIHTDEAALDELLTWNVFRSLDGHRDPDWLAHRMQTLGGSGVRAPVDVALFTGRDRGTPLLPGQEYLALVRQRAGGDVAAFRQPVEVPVMISSPGVLTLVDTTLDRVAVGNGGRERIAELVDVGLEQANRLGAALAVAVVYASGTPAASALSQRVNALRQPGALAAELGRTAIPPVTLREASWQQVVKIWDAEAGWLPLSGQPVKAFRELLTRKALR